MYGWSFYGMLEWNTYDVNGSPWMIHPLYIGSVLFTPQLLERQQ